MSFDDIFTDLDLLDADVGAKETIKEKKNKKNDSRTNTPSIREPAVTRVSAEKIDSKEDLRLILKSMLVTYPDWKKWFLGYNFDVSYINALKKQYTDKKYKKESNLFALYISFQLYFKHLLSSL